MVWEKLNPYKSLFDYEDGTLIRFMKLSIVKAPTSVLEKAFDLRRYAVTYAAPYETTGT